MKGKYEIRWRFKRGAIRCGMCGHTCKHGGYVSQEIGPEGQLVTYELCVKCHAAQKLEEGGDEMHDL